MAMDSVLGRLRSMVEDTQVFASPQARRRFVIHAVVLAIFVVAVTVLTRRHLSFLSNAPEVRAFIRQYGVWSPVVLIALQALQVVVAPVPGQVLAVVAGFLFGPWWGTLYNMIGITIGSTVAFWLSRRFGRSYVEQIVHEDTLGKFDAISDQHVKLSLFLFFVVPGLPDDVLCFVGGLTRVPLWQLVVIAVVGRAPGFFLVNAIGGYLGTGQFLAAAVLAVLLLAISALGYLNRDRFFGLFDER
jgi:uncharacterized membrane protein YdjX (TVP38/TMEM64 family)